MQISATKHQDELAQLKTICEQRRSSGKRTRYPANFQRRVAALRQAGVAASQLREELGVSWSQLYRWVAEKNTDAAPKVVNVQEQQHERAKDDPAVRQPLRLQLGHYRVTIELAGGN